MTLDFDQFDYSLALQDNGLHICEGDKKKNTLRANIDNLSSIIGTLSDNKKQFSDTNVKLLSSYVDACSAKVKEKICKEHTWFGGAIVWLQKNLGFGTLGKLERVRSAILTMQQKGQEPIDVIVDRKAKKIFQAISPAPISPPVSPQKHKPHLPPGPDVTPPPAPHVEPDSSLGPDESVIVPTKPEKPINKPGKEPHVPPPLPKPPQTLEQRIQERAEQLLKVKGVEETALEPLEALQIATFIETRIVPADNIAKSYFRKGEEGLPRALHVNLAAKEVYVIGDPKKIASKVSGVSKRAVKAARVALQHVQSEPEVVVQLLTKLMKKKSEKVKLKDVQKNVRDVNTELARHGKVKHIEGVAPVLAVTDFTQTVGKVRKVPRKSIVMKNEGVSFRQLMAKKQQLPLSAQLGISQKLFKTFSEIHKTGVIHGDIKAENILLNQAGNPRVIDFGLSFDINGEPSHMFKEGFYGSMTHSSPEMFGVENFDGDFTKTESWALGCMLYELHFGKELPWFQAIANWRDDKTAGWKDYPDLQAKFKQQVATEIEQALRDLPPEGARSPEQQYQALIYGLMRLKPEDRLSMADALEEAEKIEL